MNRVFVKTNRHRIAFVKPQVYARPFSSKMNRSGTTTVLFRQDSRGNASNCKPIGREACKAVFDQQSKNPFEKGSFSLVRFFWTSKRNEQGLYENEPSSHCLCKTAGVRPPSSFKNEFSPYINLCIFLCGKP